MTDQTFDAEAETVTDAWEGVFIYASWGYGQTNVDMAQIVDVSDTGKTVLCRMVAAEVANRETGTNGVRPTAEHTSDEFRLHVRASRDEPAFRGSYPFADGGTRKDSFFAFPDDVEGTVHETPHGYKH